MSSCPIRIKPSLLSADFARLGEALALVSESQPPGRADAIHLDVMDGHFVPNLTIGPPVLKALRPRSALPLEAHLMIANAETHLASYVETGVDQITVHAEACLHLDRVLGAIRELGCRPGVALNPATPPSVLAYVLDKVSQVLVMTVNPGFGGQVWQPAVLGKVRTLAAQLRELPHPVELQVDGGVNEATIGPLARAGATSFVVGSAVFGTPDPVAALGRLRHLALEATLDGGE